MKKVFAIFAMAGIMVACGNKGDKKADAIDAAKDSASKMMDKAVDSAGKMMDKAVDSAGKMMDKAVDTMKSKM